MRFVVDVNDPINVGNCLKELRAMCHPEQCYIYCQMANKRGRYNLIKSGFPKVLFNKDVVVGKNTIAKFLPNLARAAGIENWKAKTPHVLRQWFITRLANDKTLNPSDVAKAARQKNLASQQAYVRETEESELAKFNALQNPFAASSSIARPQAAFPMAAMPGQNCFDLTGNAAMHPALQQQQQLILQPYQQPQLQWYQQFAGQQNQAPFQFPFHGPNMF